MKLLVGVVVVAGLHVASAQSVTTGAVEGRIAGDVELRIVGERGERIVRTAADGSFLIDGLLPGDYSVFYGGDLLREDVHVDAGVVRRIGWWRFEFDRTDAALRWVADRDRLLNVPASADSTAAAGAAPTGQGDGYGTAFADTSSLDNRYFVDGMDTTDLRSGGGGTVLPSELLQGLSVTTGGGGVEVGGAGGVVSVILPSGTNELHGTVFGSWSPTALQTAARSLELTPQTIDVSRPSTSSEALGFTLAGPIVKNRAWFFIGFAPQFSRSDYTRTVQRFTDCRSGTQSVCDPALGDGFPDVDRATGLPIVDVVDSEVRTATTSSYPIVAKVDVALPRSQAAVTAIIVPSVSATPEMIGDASSGSRVAKLSSDLGARWSLRLDDKMHVDVQVAWHRATTRSGALDPLLDDQPRTYVVDGALRESAMAVRGCSDAPADDPYPMIINCPGSVTYPTGGPGLLQHDLQDRRTARVELSDREYLLGVHDLKIGGEIVNDVTRTARVFSGGELDTYESGALPIHEQELFVNLSSIDDPDPRFARACSNPNVVGPLRCQSVGGDVNAPGSSVDAQSIAWAAYVGDSWQPRSDVTIDVGLRYEAQRLLYPDDLRGRVDPLTGAHLGDVALSLDNNIAPRIGITYDPTGQGRSKLFARWGRYFERLPTSIIEREFTRSVTDNVIPGVSLNIDGARPAIDPALKAGYEDELVAGGAYELANTTLGATWQHRRLGRVVDDVSLNNTTYVITNPGHGSQAAVIDQPQRDYDAVALTALRSFARLSLQASYVWSRTVGNYQGSIDYDDGEAAGDHVSPQFDQPSVVTNTYGALPQDHTHRIKIDGFYTLPIGDSSLAIVGARFRAVSGAPREAFDDLDADALLLPRGSLGRSEFFDEIDLHFGYRRRLSRNVTGELYVDVLNIFDSQPELTVDTEYSNPAETVLPISGGSYSDLIWLRTTDPVPRLALRNPDFGKATVRYAPTSATLGARVSF